jgi:hypothetical protein
MWRGQERQKRNLRLQSTQRDGHRDEELLLLRLQSRIGLVPAMAFLIFRLWSEYDCYLSTITNRERE